VTRRRLAFAAFTLLCLLSARPAFASEESGWMPAPDDGTTSQGSGTVTCESRNDERKRCTVRNLDTGSVHVQRNLSQTQCRRGSNWGTERDAIWVDSGCRAVFAYRYRGEGGGSTSGGQQRTIRCESRDDRRNRCDVQNIEPGSVTLRRQLSESSCYRGQSWGADSRGIWVDKGCRAEFRYVTRWR
jgi:hypothetical protein